MGEALISNQNFSGTLTVSGRDIRFRAEGRKNRVQLTNAGFNKKTGKWILFFGRYGRFEVRKGQLSALDAELTRLFEAAARLQAA